jgi:hypothetical protein
MKVIRAIFVVCAFFILMGCATIPGPKSESDNLVIGIIVHTGEGYTNNAGATVNGTHFSGIELVVKNTSTNEEYKLLTKKNGLFYTSELPEGTYRIEQFYLKVTVGTAWSDTYSSPSSNLTFAVAGGEVTNLGMINWDGKSRGGSNYDYGKLYNAVEDEFRAQFPKSEWLTRPFSNVRIQRS